MRSCTPTAITPRGELATVKLGLPLATRSISSESEGRMVSDTIATSGTRREEKLFKAEQVEAVHALRRGLSQMPPQAAMEWLIKRIAATSSNDVLLASLIAQKE